MRKSLLRCVTPLMALALVLSACGRTPAKTLAERYADGELGLNFTTRGKSIFPADR